MPCDALLLEDNCVVSESLLTGEATTVVKRAIESIPDGYEEMNFSKIGKNTLFCGTNVIQSRGSKYKNGIALVIRTGFLTLKGRLVRQILYPTEIKFKFYEDSLKFIAALGVMSLIGVIISIPTLKDEPWLFMLDRMINLVTITVPPSLATVMS